MEIKKHNVMVDGRHFFYQPVKDIWRTYGNIQKITTDQGDDYTTGFLFPLLQKLWWSQ